MSTIRPDFRQHGRSVQALPTLLLLLATLVIAHAASAGELQDSIRIPEPNDRAGSDDTATVSSFPARFRLSGAGYYQTLPLGGYNHPAPYSPRGRFTLLDPREYPWREENVAFTDNPLYHAAYFFDLQGVVKPVDMVEVEIGIVGEMRGMSYGVRNMSNLAFYPHLLVSFRDTLSIAGEDIRVAAAYGDFEQMTSLLPVAIYNTDVQGGRVSISWRKLRGTYERIGDMYRGIGLNIEDANQLALGLQDISLGAGTTARIELMTYHVGYGLLREGRHLLDFFLVAPPTYTPGSPRDRLLREISPGPYGYALLAQTTWTDGRDLQISGLTNVALRGAESSGMIMSRTAFLAAIGIEGDFEELRFSIDGAYRYYGGLFNAGFRNDEPSYRTPVNPGTQSSQFSYTYANSVGPYLYPLSNLDYPFSRWPVYAEYQDLKDVTGWTLYGKGEVDLSERILLEGMLDLNLIVPEKAESAFYPFFSIGLGYRPVSSFTASFTLTNRTMNLDKHYPTYYLVNGVIGEVALRWDVGL